MFFSFTRLALVASCLILSGCQLMATKSAPATNLNSTKYQEYIQSGDVLPISAVKSISGEVINLNHENRKKLVILFATWCSDSNRALKALNNSPLLTRKDIDIVAIARQETVDVVKAWGEKNNIKVTLAADEDRAIFSQFAAAGIPRFITVDEANRVIQMNLAEGEEQLSKIVWSI